MNPEPQHVGKSDGTQAGTQTGTLPEKVAFSDNARRRSSPLVLEFYTRYVSCAICTAHPSGTIGIEKHCRALRGSGGVGDSDFADVELRPFRHTFDAGLLDLIKRCPAGNHIVGRSFGSSTPSPSFPVKGGARLTRTSL